MSLREWDRKARALKEEITTLMKQVGERSVDDTEKKLINMQKRLPQLENKLAQDLSFLNSQSQRRGFFTNQEKAILHWAGEYAKRAHVFFRDYSETFHELFWAKLVQTRGESVSAHGDGNFFAESGRLAANKQQRKLYEARSVLKEKLRHLDKRKQELGLRYDNLAISKANREAVCPHITDQKYFSKLKGLLNHPKTVVKLPYEYLNLEAKKLAVLTASIQNYKSSKKSGGKNKRKKKKNPIESFDYLQLDEPYLR